MTKAAGWAARLALVVGGVTLAVRLGAPQVASPVAEPSEGQVDSDDTGRGKPGTPPSRQARKAGHETEDMSGGTMARLIIALGVIVALLAFGMVGLRILFERLQASDRPPLTAEQTTPVTPPAPNLQADPPMDLSRLRAREDQLLGTYAWADAGHTRARIPVDRAMSMLVGKPLDTAP